MNTRPVSEIAVAPPTASEMDIAALFAALVTLVRGSQDHGMQIRGNISPMPAPASTQAAPMRTGVSLQHGRHQLPDDAGQQERGPDPERSVVVEPGTEPGLHLRGAQPSRARRRSGSAPDSHGGTS